jgi:hypothetical protein
MRQFRGAVLAISLPFLGCTATISGGGDDGDMSPPPGPGPQDPGNPSGPDGGDCARVQVDLKDVTPTVELLIDRSGSMNQGYGDTTRWNAVYSTLMDPTTGLVGRLDGQVRFGIALYTSQNGNQSGTCPIIESVAPALGNAASIEAMYDGKQPVEDTPTAPSIVAAQAILSTVTDPGPKLIVLATDGLPDTCDVPDPDGQPQALADSVAAAQGAHTAGSNLYIISVGPDVAQSHLQDMANAGVGLAIGGPDNAPYYRALDPDSLVNAFDTVVSGVRTCTFALDGQVDMNTADNGTVTLDGTPLQYGSQWKLDDSSTLEILGDACDTLKGGGDHHVAAEFTCTSIVD